MADEHGYGTALTPPEEARLRVLGVRVDDMPASMLLDKIENAVVSGGRLMVVNANAHLVMLARSRPWIARLFDHADVVFCDGAGVQFAIHLLHGRLPHRHTPPEWIDELAHRLARRNASVYWLGGEQATAELAADRLYQRTGLSSVGVHHGFFDITEGSAGTEAVVRDINRARPDVLLLNMGMPRQEAWLAANWDRLDVRVGITAGALVDHVAGRVRRPPAWVARYGLEWLVRLAIEPQRLWRRYVLGLPRFAVLVFLEKARLLSFGGAP